MNPVIIIPARMKSVRLPGKPIADIAGKPMIVHVCERAEEACSGDVFVACAEQEIADVIAYAGKNFVLTDPDHPSGTDRIFEALNKIDENGRFDLVINVQGDLPTLDPQIVKEIIKPFADDNVDISTLVAKIEDEEEIKNPNVVKAIAKFENEGNIAIANDFKREVEEEEVASSYHHIGIYAYRKKALENFTSLDQSAREQERKLEQMRALDNGMTIAAVLVDAVPFGVDTEQDLQRAREILNKE